MMQHGGQACPAGIVTSKMDSREQVARIIVTQTGKPERVIEPGVDILRG